MRIELQVELNDNVSVAFAANYIQKAAQEVGEATILDVDYEDRGDEIEPDPNYPHPEEVAEDEFLKSVGE